MATIETQPPSSASVAAVHPDAFPPDVVRLLEVLARIEQRRQLHLRQVRAQEAS